MWPPTDVLHRLPANENASTAYTHLINETTRMIFCQWTPGRTRRQQQNGSFSTTGPPGRMASPIELLLLGSLQYLGWGLTFDDLEESTLTGQDVHWSFFHSFVEYHGEKKLFSKFVNVPLWAEALDKCEYAYRITGFPGCVGRTDATHIPLELFAFTICQGHLGFKMSATTQTYNMTVNHKHKFLHSTGSHPDRWNDKTLARYDMFMNRLWHGGFDDKMSFARHAR